MTFDDDDQEDRLDAAAERLGEDGEDEGEDEGAPADSQEPLESDSDDSDGGDEARTDFEAEAKRRAEMIDYLKRDIHDERKRRQEAERRLQEFDAKAREEERGGMDRRIEAARESYARLLEDGDGAQIAKASEELTALVVRRETMAHTAPRQATTTEDPDASEGAAPAERQIAAAAQRWIARNQWFTKGGDLAAKAVEIATELEGQGYDTDDPELYAEVDRRLKPYRQRMNGNGRAPNAAPVSRGAGVDARPGRKLTNEDKRIMREVLRWDPNKPEHRRAYLRRNDPLE